jgi:hypothetical protein
MFLNSYSESAALGLAEPNSSSRWRVVRSTQHTPVAFIRKQSSCPPSTIFRVISWQCKLIFLGFLPLRQKKKNKDKKNWFGSNAESKQQKLNMAFSIDAFLCQTSLLLQKQ